MPKRLLFSCLFGLSMAVGSANAADHSDSPLIRPNETFAEVTDVYAFINPQTGTEVANGSATFAGILEVRARLGMGPRPLPLIDLVHSQLQFGFAATTGGPSFTLDIDTDLNVTLAFISDQVIAHGPRRHRRCQARGHRLRRGPTPAHGRLAGHLLW